MRESPKRTGHGEGNNPGSMLLFRVSHKLTQACFKNGERLGVIAVDDLDAAQLVLDKVDHDLDGFLGEAHIYLSYKHETGLMVLADRVKYR